jgi:hypothetical protein
VAYRCCRPEADIDPSDQCQNLAYQYRILGRQTVNWEVISAIAEVAALIAAAASLII